MIILPDEIRRFEALLSDIKSKCIPEYLALEALQAFFAENPHLLMLGQFDEHEQHALSRWDRWAAARLTPGPNVAFERFSLLPQLRYRTPSGRWAVLLRFPGLDGIYELIGGFDDLLFSFKLNQVVSDFRRLLESKEAANKGEVLSEEDAEEVWEEKCLEWSQEVITDAISIPFEDFIADLHKQVIKPRIKASTLWSPRMWTLGEQQRQRALVDDVLRPHLSRWECAGVCLQDLNPSEFEDLVGGLLLEAGLKVHKVRESPLGGRDLIARGTLIPGEEPIEMAVEVKHRKVVGRPEVEMALHQNRAYPALVFVTSGRFTAGVFQEKSLPENRQRLFLKDGMAIGDLVRCHFGLQSPARSRV